LGWWGVISCWVNMVVVPMDVFGLVKALFMRRPSDPPMPALQGLSFKDWIGIQRTIPYLASHAHESGVAPAPVSGEQALRRDEPSLPGPPD
jgi:hypothetical protein